MRELGYVEGQNLVVEYRWAEGRLDRLPELAGELGRLGVDVIVAHTTPGALAAKQAAGTIPVAHVKAGGLLSYGVRLEDLFRRSAYYVDKILKGAKPADLPVEQATKFELVMNPRAAKALGFTIPPSVLARGDEVIQ